MHARHCFEQIKLHFGSTEWQEKHEKFKVTKIIPFYATTADIGRPVHAHEYDRCIDIRKSRGYMALQAGVVLQRPFDCWCHACMAAMGSGKGTMDSGHEDLSYRVEGCNDVEARYEVRQVNRCDARGVAVRREKAQTDGNAHAAKLKIGDWVGVENNGGIDTRDRYWIGKVVSARSINRRAKGPCVGVALKKGKMAGCGKLGFNPGEVGVAVQWYERDERFPERRTFYPGDITTEVFNASDLRWSSRTSEWRLSKLPVPVPVRIKKKGASVKVSQSAEDQRANELWEFPAEAETELLDKMW